MRYFGGKFRLAPWIIQHFGGHRVYVESFGGAASVLMLKPRSYAEIYNELDDEVVNVFRVLRDRETGTELERILRLTPFARAEFEAAYQPAELESVERARRTIVKAFMGFGSNAIQVRTAQRRGFRTRISTVRPSTGFRARISTHEVRPPTGFRADSNRSGTTPASDWRNYFECLQRFIDRLQGVVIEQRSALDVIRQFDRPDTLHYVDPPYPHSTRQDPRNDGYRFEMTDDQHRQMSSDLHAAAGLVVVSGYPCDLYDKELFADWLRISRPARADRARAATEVLWLNPRAASALPQATLFSDAGGA